jgi:hypothetical protein
MALLRLSWCIGQESSLILFLTFILVNKWVPGVEAEYIEFVDVSNALRIWVTIIPTLSSGISGSSFGSETVYIYLIFFCFLQLLESRNRI